MSGVRERWHGISLCCPDTGHAAVREPIDLSVTYNSFVCFITSWEHVRETSPSVVCASGPFLDSSHKQQKGNPQQHRDEGHSFPGKLNVLKFAKG